MLRCDHSLTLPTRISRRTASLRGRRREEGSLLRSFHGPKGPFFHRAQPGATPPPGMPKTGLAWGPRGVPHGYRCMRAFGARKGLFPGFLFTALKGRSSTKARTLKNWYLRQKTGSATAWFFCESEHKVPPTYSRADLPIHAQVRRVNGALNARTR
jgi:hypothetical protein